MVLADPVPANLRAHGWARPWLLLNAVIAWCAIALSVYLSISGYYLGREDTSKLSLLGNLVSGHDQWYERLFDWLTYFTIWSNIVVAVALTVLWRRPDLFERRDATGEVWRALRLDSVLMIAVTGIVYRLLLATPGKSGADLVSDTLLHVVVPLVTVVLWVVVGPRGIIDRRAIAGSLVLPVGWAVVALVRGSVVGAYPYSFLDVGKNGLVAVLGFIVVILVVALLLALLLLALDRVLPPRAARD